MDGRPADKIKVGLLSVTEIAEAEGLKESCASCTMCGV
jgi:hypothetical protein